ncbi:MAG: HAMP domain-containing protein [Deltaproteobacteria bacterium]|nr:HAMP domain-containing protein [Deltaproteobacteria bacterium]MBT4525431.1 HAMP domain-containing protein [Deltaproteobacteria bacterium]
MIKFKLSHKIFFSFFATSLVIVGLMIFILKYYVSDSFSTYINKIELDSFDTIAQTLESHYQKKLNWNAFQNNHSKWQQLVWSAIGDGGMGTLSQPRQGDKQRKYRRRRMTGLSTDQTTGNSMHQRGSMMGLGRRLTLLDIQKHSLIDNENDISLEDYLLKPLRLNNEIIGWLGYKKAMQLTNPLDITFLKSQTQILYFTGAGILILAAIFSFLLSRHLLQPIKTLIRGTKNIASRKFDSRIIVNTGDEFNDLAEQFNQMSQTLESYEDLRKQWFSDISHELGTPLSILRGEIEALQDGIRLPSNENLESLHYEVNHISKIVNDLRELSLAETGAMQLDKSPIAPIDILQKSILFFTNEFNSKKLKIINNLNSSSSIIHGDEQRLHQVFHNLLENNLKYTHQPGSVIFESEINHQNLIITVRDSGPGVPDGSIDSLFDRLYRVDTSRNRKTGGSGLGLAICKYIIINHQGEISASNFQNGLQIKISLPLNSTP